MEANDYWVAVAAAGLLLFGVLITLGIHWAWFGTHRHQRRRKKDDAS